MPHDIFAVTRSRGPGWDDAQPMEEQPDWRLHADFMDSLHRDGFVILVGPLAGTRDVLLVVRASDEEDIRRRLAADPWSRNGLLDLVAIRRWTLRLGALPA